MPYSFLIAALDFLLSCCFCNLLHVLAIKYFLGSIQPLVFVNDAFFKKSKARIEWQEANYRKEQ